jgi:hypothetical protein
MALTKVTGSGVEGITNLSNATFLSVDASEVATLLTTAVINSEGGAATTSIVQGLAKMFCTFNGTSTIAIADSFNASGITDRGTGLYTVTIGNDMASGNHTPSTSCKKEDGTDDGNLMSVAGSGTGYTNVATEVRVLTRRVEDTASLDSPAVYVLTHGDLA